MINCLLHLVSVAIQCKRHPDVVKPLEFFIIHYINVCYPLGLRVE